jgi:SpoVK/Ycf46/Vps4 family AAA+-type ATPase
VPVLRGAPGSGRRALVSTIAQELGAQLLVVRCGELPPERLGPALIAIQREAVLARAVIVLADAERLAGDEPGRADRTPAVEAAFASFAGPLALTVGGEASTPLFARTRGAVVVELPPLSEAERAVLWGRHVPAELAAEAAARYRLTGGQIEGAANAAYARTDEPTAADLHAGVRAMVDDRLSALGVRIEWRQAWADLVLPDDSLDELREMVSRVRHRRRVLEDWGFGAKVAKGLGTTALFSGPPGTGKTMAAGLVAGELGLDLYQIDLSRMVSKYVGETEKNLAQVFEAAETGHAILLFDEADALFARRTEVKSSVDRYANLEVNYLLQRMEAFTGITILTTNFDAAIDEAFRRRLAFRIQFPMPEVAERARLWRAMMPERARIAPDIDFGQLADRFAMSGGYIRNAALRAAFLAAGDGDLIHMRHLLKAARAEYASMGKVIHGAAGGL